MVIMKMVMMLAVLVMITSAASLPSASYLTFAWAYGEWSAICFVSFRCHCGHKSLDAGPLYMRLLGGVGKEAAAGLSGQ